MIRRFVVPHIIPALLAMVVFFTTLPFIESVVRLHDRTREAITWHSVKVVTPVVSPGETLEVVYSATINKQCPSDVRGFFVAPDGSVPVRMATTAGGYARPSDGPVDVRVKLLVPVMSDSGLAPLQSGEYIYRTLVTRYCPDGVEDDNSVPDVKFRLEVPQ